MKYYYAFHGEGDGYPLLLKHLLFMYVQGLFKCVLPLFEFRRSLLNIVEYPTEAFYKEVPLVQANAPPVIDGGAFITLRLVRD